MPNTIKYSLTTQTQALKKGNFWLGTNDIGKGPSVTTNYWNGITPPVGGYTVYLNDDAGLPSIYCPSNDSELISLTNRFFGQTFTTTGQVFEWFATQPNKLLLNKDLPAIVTDSLSMYVDTSHVSSYPKGGNKWYDLVNGLEFDSQGTPLSLNPLGGVEAFEFNGSGYWRCSTNSNLVNMGGDCTLIMWVYSPSSIGSRRTIFEKEGTGGLNSFQQEIAVTWETPDIMTYYSRQNPSYDYAYVYNILFNGTWNMVSIKMSTGLTSADRTGFYSINGSNWIGGQYYTRSNTALTPAGDILIGSGYAGSVIAGGIGSVICYNKMLSDSEILQNWNATKSRYGY